MKIGVVSDIHANEVALNAVLEDMPPVDKKICCGDIVGDGPSPEDCVNIVKDNFDIVVKGNHDHAVAEGDLEDLDMSEEFARRVLSSENLKWIKKLPEKVNKNNIKVVHDHPDKKMKYVYPKDFPRISSKYTSPGEILLMGHTHVLHTYRTESLVANPGSVGQPKDGNVFSPYIIIDTETLDVEINRVSYDINKVKRRIMELGFPRYNYNRLFKGE